MKSLCLVESCSPYRYFRILVCTLIISVAACAANNEQPQNETLAESSQEQEMGLNPADPWESLNRRTFAFNDFLDRYFLKPVAQGYVYITPSFFRTGVSNVFSNLTEPVYLVNNILQGDMEGVVTTTMRFATNTTLGFFGLFEVATEVGMRKDSEDFGQTLGVWGIEQGNYLVLPFFGPSSTRDVFSFADMAYYSEYWPLQSSDHKLAAVTLKYINLRASLLDLEKQLDGVDDHYSFIRDVWLQRRDFLLNDGAIAQDDFGAEDDLEEEEEEDFGSIDDEF